MIQKDFDGKKISKKIIWSPPENVGPKNVVQNKFLLKNRKLEIFLKKNLFKKRFDANIQLQPNLT